MADGQTAREYLDAVKARLEADGCATRQDTVDGAPALVGRRADFRLQWAATRLHLFTVARAVPEVTVREIERFTSEAQSYARKSKGGLPVGLQTGIAVFPVLVGDVVDPAAAAWAEEKQRNQFGCMARPVVVDTSRRHVSVYRGRPLIGAVYGSHLNKKSSAYFLGPGWTGG